MKLSLISATIWWLCCITAYSQTTWQALPPFLKIDHAATNSFAVSPASGALYVSTEKSGLQRSTDEGHSWQSILNQPVFTVKVRLDGTIFAGGAGILHISTDEGQTWTARKIATSYPISQIVFNKQGHIFAGTSTIAESTNPGLSGDGVFTSTDNGQSWHSLNNGLSNLNVVVLAIDTNDQLYIGTSENEQGRRGGLYTMAANEPVWTKIAVSLADLPDIAINYFFMLGIDQYNHIYISIEGSYDKIGVLRTLKSEDSGATWRVVGFRESPGGPYFDEMYLQSFFLSKSGLLWTSIPARLGIYYADDKGTHWMLHMAGMSSSYNIVDFAETKEGKLLALQRYNSNIIYIMSRPLAVAEPLPPSSLFLSCYPSPFNNELTIKYKVSTPTPVQVTITDLWGKQVYIHTQNSMNGLHTITWQPANTAAGLYIVQLQTDRHREMQRVVLTK